MSGPYNGSESFFSCTPQSLCGICAQTKASKEKFVEKNELTNTEKQALVTRLGANATQAIESGFTPQERQDLAYVKLSIQKKYGVDNSRTLAHRIGTVANDR